MAVAFDARSEATQDTGTSMTWSHTCSGSDRALYVAVAHENGSTDVDVVTGTYNGEAMDVVFTDTTTNGSRHTRVLRKLNPATGSNNIVLNWGGASRAFSAVAASFTGVDQGDPDDAQSVDNNTGGATSQSVTVSSAVGDMVMDVLICGSSTSNVAVAQGNTEINQIFAGQNANGIACSYEAGAASVTIGWSWTPTIASVLWAFNINAAAGGGASVAIEGDVDAVSTITGGVAVTRGVQGSITPVSTINGAVTLSKGMSGTVAAVSTINGSASCAYALTSRGGALVQWNQSSEPDLAGYRIKIGTVSETYTTTLDVGLTPTPSAPSYVVGGLTPGTTYYMAVFAYDTSGNESDPSDEITVVFPNGCAITSSIAGTLTNSVDLGGSVASVSTINGALAGAKPLAGSLDIVSEINGDLSLDGQVVLAGTLDAALEINAALDGAKPLAGLVGCESAITGSLAVARPLVANCDAVASLSASLEVTGGMAGFIICTSSISAAMDVAMALAGSTDAVSSIQGALSVQGLVGEPFKIIPVKKRTFTFAFTKEG